MHTDDNTIDGNSYVQGDFQSYFPSDLQGCFPSDLHRDLHSHFRSSMLPVTVFICVEIALGLLGNSVVLYGFTFRYPRCTYRCLILSLAVVDMLSCLITMPGEVFNQLFWFQFSYVTLCKVKSFANVFTLSTEILVLLIIAVDRYKQTCTPHTIQMSPGLVMYLFSGSFVTAACLAIPAGIGFGKHKYDYEYKGTNVTVVTCALSDEYAKTDFNLIYSICLQTTACLSLVVMFVIYIVILKSIYCGQGPNELQCEATPLLYRGNDEEGGAKLRTVQMFTVSIVFILTSLTCRVLGFIVNTHFEGFSIKDTVIVVFFYRLYFINHVIHPWIYGILDLQFRGIMKTMCCTRSQNA